ncbi:MAG TPA: UMP kinase, partial [Thermopetrobacter sp.]|nr:UMP kinase [Thermopetrobacter sp.]
MADGRFKRVLVKISGEVLMGRKDFGLDMDMLARIAGEVAAAVRAGHEVGLVIGGGNIFRGVAGVASGMERTSADGLGMLATVMNAIAVAGALEKQGVPALVMSAVAMEPIARGFDQRAADAHLKAGGVVIFAAGTGHPFFTTDSGAALRALQMGCDAMLKGTSVDGVYAADPKTDPAAQRFATISYTEVLKRDLKIMDATAIALARDNGLPLVVFSIREAGALADVLRG